MRLAPAINTAIVVHRVFFLARCCLGCESEQNDPQKKAHDLVLLLWCVFGFLFCECLGIPNSPRSLDLDDRQGLIARSAMQQKKKKRLVAAWVKSRAERPSVSGVNRQLHVQIGCKLGIRNRNDELTKQAKRNKLQIKKPEGN